MKPRRSVASPSSIIRAAAGMVTDLLSPAAMILPPRTTTTPGDTDFPATTSTSRAAVIARVESCAAAATGQATASAKESRRESKGVTGESADYTVKDPEPTRRV